MLCSSVIVGCEEYAEIASLSAPKSFRLITAELLSSLGHSLVQCMAKFSLVHSYGSFTESVNCSLTARVKVGK